MFATVGLNQLKMWKLETDQSLLFYEMDLPEEIHLTAIDYTPFMNAPYNQNLLIVGDSNGNILLVGTNQFDFIAKIDNVFNSAIGLIQVKDQSILICN